MRVVSRRCEITLPILQRSPSHPCWRSVFFDGDGSIHVKRSGGGLSPSLSISQAASEEAIATLSQFHFQYGGSFSASKPRDIANPGIRPMYHWAASGPAILPVLEDLGRGLIVKRPQAELMIAHMDLFPGRPGVRVSDSVKQARNTLRQSIRRVRAQAPFAITLKEYSDQFLEFCEEQMCAYAAGFCDADGCYICHAAGPNNIMSYRVFIAQNNRPFLQAFKHVILKGGGSNIHTRKCGASVLAISKQRDVLDFCARVRPFSITKACQLDVILSQPPSAKTKEVLASMHGNQGKKPDRVLP